MSTQLKIERALRRRPANIDNLVRVYDAYAMRGGVSVAELIKETGLPEATFFRALKTLREVELMGEMGEYREFNLPMAISSGVLPPPKYSTAHLAAYLTKFKDDEKVPPYDKTKKQIMKEFKDTMSLDAAMGADIVFGIQDRLAMLAMFTGNLAAFEKMVGNCAPPETLPF